MAGLLLAVAIVLEVCGTVCMKLSEGFTKVVPSIAIFPFYGLAFVTLVFVMQRIPLSLTYAIWSGVGTAIAALIGFTYFREEFDVLKLIGIVLIIVGVVVINLRGH
ncbi:Multidrug resistance protein EbrA [Planctomycetes bacterium Pan216]|uniref:Multidrug resistance protein EbrA n=1 Tax=Kolteria novifilia TaxID=2527975 RepID=A0A518B8R4_9BACT|nr:Multidrug resistance protein EbrA [Planctomycetes bacterium Pan216]